MRIILVPRTSHRDAGTNAANSAVPETSERTLDPIAVAEFRNTLSAALREAFDAGRAQKAEQLKAIMAAFLDALMGADEAGRSELLRAVAGIDDRTAGGSPLARP